MARKIFVALASGMALGLVFGEHLAFLGIFGRAFIQLLQITVLPYVAGSLIYGFGSLGGREARLVFTRGGALLAGLWAMALGLVFVSPLALPAGKGGAFFSAVPGESERPIDWVSLYIPANPFYALANNVVPAVVVFAVLAGVALMGMREKETLLRPLGVFNDAMGRVGAMVTRLTPYGIFAIAGHTAATMRLEEFERLQGFLPLELASYPVLAGAGLLAVFGSINTAIPFLLDLVKIPTDHFQLFVVSGVLNSRFGAMASAMHTLVIAILGTCLITGRLRIDKARLVRFAVVSALMVAGFVAGTRLLLATALPDPLTRAEVLAAIRPRGPFAPARTATARRSASTPSSPTSSRSPSA